jgi:integrase
MVIRTFLALGLKAGEVLNLRVGDIRPTKIFIRKCSDNQGFISNVQNMPRTLTITDSLAAVIRIYIAHDRQEIPGARKHDFLLVSSMDGIPLSSTSLSNIFAAVSNKFPVIQRAFTPTICRYTWNNRFTDICVKYGVQEEVEKRIRCRYMGWRVGNPMADKYIKLRYELFPDEENRRR